MTYEEQQSAKEKLRAENNKAVTRSFNLTRPPPPVLKPPQLNAEPAQVFSLDEARSKRRSNPTKESE